MNRIKELAKAYLEGKITAKAFRSALIAQLSMMDEDTTSILAIQVYGENDGRCH